jgi:hypothetical protein
MERICILFNPEMNTLVISRGEKIFSPSSRPFGKPMIFITLLVVCDGFKTTEGNGRRMQYLVPGHRSGGAGELHSVKFNDRKKTIEKR